MPHQDEELAEALSLQNRAVAPTEPVPHPQDRRDILAANLPTATLRPGGLRDPDIVTFGPISHQQFGDYLVQNEIAHGGMGVVYKAYHQGLNRVVALKCLKSGTFAQEHEIQRFRVEAQSAARLDHPNIVPVFDVGARGGLHYYAMGYVEGETLASKLRTGPMLPRAGAKLIETLARAIDYAHQQGVIHRDLKPGNILIDHVGQPRITDFGLAKRSREDSNLTVSGEIIGTPNFIPPEQADGRNHEVGPASDIYSLGAILYCVLTGRPPFQAALINETLQQVLNCEPVSPRRLNPNVPKDLETICLKCLQKTPTRRYASATDLAEDLRRYLDGTPIVARPIRGMERTYRWCVRNPIVASLMALVVLVAVVGASVSLSFAVRLSSKVEEAAGFLEDANQVTARLEAEQSRSKQVLYQSQIQQAYWEWRLGNTRRLSELLKACDESHRGWEYHFLSDAPRRGHQLWSGHNNTVLCLAVTPDGRQLVSGSRDRTLRIWDIASGRELQKFEEHRAEVTCVALSREGRWLLSGSADKTVRVWDMKTWTQRRVIRTIGDGVKSLAITPDGAKVVVATDNGTVKVVHFGSFEEQHTLQTAGIKVHSVAVSPDGKLVAAGFGNAIARLWNLETGAEVAAMTGPGGAVNCVAFDPSGKWLARGSQDGVVKVWNVSAGTEQHTLQGHFNAVMTVAFSSDSQRLVSGGSDHMLCEWDVESGVLRRTLRGHSRIVTCVVMPRESRHIISGSDDVSLRIWEPETEQESAVATGHEAWIDLAVFNPAQTLVATSSADHSVRLWDVATGRPAGICQEPVTRVEALKFTRDGQRLVCIDGDGQLHTFDVATGKRLDLRTDKHVCAAAALSDSLQHLVTGGTDKVVSLWRADDGAKLAELTGHTDEIHCLAIDPSEKWIASGSLDKTVRIWDLAGRRVRHVLEGHTKRPRSVAFDTTGTKLVTASDDTTVRVWDVESGKQLLELHGHGAYVRSAAFSPDGQRIVSGSLDTHVKLWDARTGDEILTLRGHRNAVLFVTFSPDGRRIASGSTDKTLRLWDSGPTSP